MLGFSDLLSRLLLRYWIMAAHAMEGVLSWVSHGSKGVIPLQSELGKTYSTTEMELIRPN